MIDLLNTGYRPGFQPSYPSPLGSPGVNPAPSAYATPPAEMQPVPTPAPGISRPTRMFGRGIGTPLQDAPLALQDPSASAPASMALPQVNLSSPHVKLHFFDKGGLGLKILTGLSDFAMRYSASQGDPFALGFFQNQWRQQQQAAEDAREQQRQNRPQLFNAGDGQILSVRPDTGDVSELHAARPTQSKVSEQQSLIDYWNTLPPDDPRRPMIERAVRGYQYAPDYMDAKQTNASQLEQQRQADRLQLRSTPTYGNLHPRSGGGSRTGGTAGYEYRVINGKLMRRKTG